MPSYPITSVVPRVQYNASTNQIEFAYNWPIFTAEDLKVYVTKWNQVASEEDDLLVLNVDYTVSGVGSQNGGYVTLTLPSVMGDIITIQREIAVERLTDYSNGNAINADTLNADFDRLTMMIQDVNVFIKDLNTRYMVPAIVPEVQTILPQLPPGYFWQGGPNSTVIPVVSLQSPDSSTLRSELAYNATADGAGANLVGYNDALAGPITVRQKLDDLTDSLSVHVLSILTFGADPTGVADTTPALNAAYSYCATNGIGTIWFPRGTYRFATQPDDAPQLLRLRGDGVTLTTINRDFDSPDSTGLFETVDGFGLQVGGMTINAMTGTTGGSAIQITSSTDFDSQISINDLIIGSDGGTWDFGLIVSGANAATLSNMTIKNVQASACTTSEFLFNNVSYADISISAPVADGGNGEIVFNGTGSFPNTNINMNVNGAALVTLQYTSEITLMCTDVDEVANTSTVSFATLYGSVTTLQTNWTNSRAIRNQDFIGSVSLSGYQKLPNGLIIQWLEVTTPPLSTGGYTLPIPFPTNNYGAFSCINTIGNEGNAFLNSANNTLSQIWIENANTNTQTYNLIVLGR